MDGGEMVDVSVATGEQVQADDAARRLGGRPVVVDFQAVGREVNVQVAYYARRCWWAEEGDLRGKAWEAALNALHHYCPEKGTVGAYVSIAIRRTLATWLTFESAPVSESWHQRHNLLGVHRAPLDRVERPQRSVFDPEDGGSSVSPGAPQAEGAGWADEVLDDRRWRVRVLSRLFEVVGEDGREGLEALLSEGPKRTGRPPQRLLDSIRIAQERIKEDEELAQAWAERSI